MSLEKDIYQKLMNKMRFVATSLLLFGTLWFSFSSPVCVAQGVNDTLSIRRSYAVEKKKLAFQLALDNRHSFLGSTPIMIIGLNAGLKIKGRYRVGIGAYTLGRKYAPTTLFSKRTKTTDTLSSALRLDFLTPNFTYTFLDRRWIELSIPVEAGVGQRRFMVRNEGTNKSREVKSLFVPVSVGAAILLKPSRWVGFTLFAGYRKSLENTYRDGFDGWYYGYRLNLFLGNVVRDWKRYHAQKQHLNPRPSLTYSRKEN